jgi:hypothetical protein
MRNWSHNASGCWHTVPPTAATPPRNPAFVAHVAMHWRDPC